MFKLWFEWEPPEVALKLIEGRATVLGPASQTPSEPWAAIADADGIIAAADLRYADDVLNRAPRLRVVSRIGIGCDNIDLAAAARRGIAICNAPNAPTTSTAEHAIALTLAVAKQIPQLQSQLRRSGRPNFFLANHGIELNGRVFGVVGLGRIGRQVATLARGLGMTVVGFDPHAGPDIFPLHDATQCKSLEELLEIADIVSLHIPLNQQTTGLFDRATFARMNPGAIFINTARGGLVDELALLDAVESGHLYGAGLDVFQNEPPTIDDPLLHCERIISTPHVASATDVSKSQLWTTAVSQALDVLEGRVPPHVVQWKAES